MKSLKRGPISIPHTSRSALQMPKITSRSNMEENNESLDKNYKSMSMHLPAIKLKKVLNKIGALNRSDHVYAPSQQQQKSFRKSKIQQLKEEFPLHKKNNRSRQPFRYQLDQIVLDCYQYGQNHGNKSVWRKYRQHIDMLTYDTLKILSKRGQY